MVNKIRVTRDRVSTAQYVLKKTKQGLKGYVKKNKKPPRSSVPNPPASGSTPGKRPRLENYIPPTEDVEIAVPASPEIAPPSDPVGMPHLMEEYREEMLAPHSGKTSKGKTSHEYMEEWHRTRLPDYLDCIVSAEARRTSTCAHCHEQEASWRCVNCMGATHFCTQCCLRSHRHLPFHRIERWNGQHWRPAWLWHVGVSICLGHGGNPCPSYQTSLEDLESRLVRVNDVDDLESDNSFGAVPKYNSSLGLGRVLSFVHVNGFHHLPVFPCWCAGSPPEDIQFLDAGLYPATYTKVSTVFTFELLEKFHLLKVHSHMSTDHFSALLRRFTNALFPAKALDRRRELARVWLQWNHLTELKKAGFAHSRRGESPDLGDLALFCAACPQPRVNLPENWKSDVNQWLYRRYLVVDGNFVLDHLITGKVDGVSLTQGAAFVAEPKRYEKHLATAKETTEVSTCAELRAVAEKNRLKKGYDATGVVAVACARHGCFAPGAVVDMQKGERQVNVDYAFHQAIKSTDAGATSGVRLAYDINCQYSINLVKRFLNSPYLSLPPTMQLEFVIGLFHVHGHKEACLARFAPTFHPGCGVTSGEIIESLWSTTNGAAKITRNMTKSGRAETLDACLQDSNRRKMQDLARFLKRQHGVTVKEKDAAVRFFGLLDGTAEPDQKAEWKAQMDTANADRGGHNTSMDIYKFRIPQVEPRKSVQARLMDSEKRERNETKGRRRPLGVTNWVAKGIDLQEAQLDLRNLLRKAANPASPGLDLVKKSEALAKRIGVFHEEAKTLFADVDLVPHVGTQWEHDEVEVCVCEQECCCAELQELPMGRVVFDASSDELAPLPLPSSFDDLPAGWEDVAKVEVGLRVAQAEESLEELRSSIAHKSCLYRAKRELAGGGRGVTRSYDEINGVEAAMRMRIKVYESARWALGKLGEGDRHRRFRPLTRLDTKAVTAVFDPNKPGERNAELSWIWTMNIPGQSANLEYLVELRRVNWIRARSRMDRWTEEVLLLESEMQWYVNFMISQKSRAETWAQLDLGNGHKSYALREADEWRRYGMEGASVFETSDPEVIEGEEAEVVIDYNPNEPLE